MAQAVIEQFEAVEVDMQQRKAATALAHALVSLAQPFAKQRTVGQARQLVIVGEVAHALLRLAPGGQIGEEAYDMTDVSPHIAHHVQL